MVKRVIGLVAGVDGNRIEPGPLLSEADLSSYESSRDLLERYYRSRSVIPFLNENFSVFKAAEVALVTHMQARRRDRVARARLFDELNRTFANLLSSVRLYRDHTLARLAGMYGKNGHEHSAFRALWRAMADAVFAFAFTWEFRNYVQHVEMPFDHSASTIQPPGDLGDEPTVTVGVNRASLLRHRRWGTLTRRIKALPDVVPVQDYLEPTLKGIEKIEFDLIEVERPRLLEYARTVIRILRPGFANGGFPGVMEVPPEGFTGGPISIELFRLDVSVFLGLVESMETPEGPSTRLLDLNNTS